MSSAVQKLPNRNGPACAKRLRQLRQTSSMRWTSALTSALRSGPSRTKRKSIGRVDRNAPKPECISAAAAHATARAVGSSGHKPAVGCCYAKYSAMASGSVINRSPSCNTGISPLGECFRINSPRSSVWKGMKISSKMAPDWRVDSQPRSDQDEQFLLPTISLYPFMLPPLALPPITPLDKRRNLYVLMISSNSGS